MTSEIRTNTITSRAGLSTVTFTDSGPMFSGITTFVDNSTFSVGTGGTIHAPATNVMALGTNSIDAIKIDSSGNVNVTGILTASSISGGVSLANGADNRVVTATGAAALTGETYFTWNGNNLAIRGGEGQNCTIELASDEGDDNADFWRVMAQSSDNALAIDHYGTGSWVEKLRITSTGLVHTKMTGTAPSWLGDTIATREKFSVFQGANFAEACFNIDVDNANSFLSHNMYYSSGWRIKKTGQPVRHLEIGTNGWRFMTGADGADDAISALTERLRIDSGGNILCGGTGVSQTNRQLVVGSNSEANLAIETHNTSASETANIRFYRSRGTAASPTTLVDNDVISNLLFYGHDGTDYAHAAAMIRVECDGTVAGNQMPGAMSFHTNVGTTYATERLRIQSNGRIKFYEDPVQRNSGAVDSFSGDGAYMQHYVSRNGSTYRRNLDIAAVGDGSWGCAIRFSTNPDSSATSLERMRIDHRGFITKPYQPSFAVYRNQQSWTIADGGKMNFNTARHNIGNHYDLSNGRFIAPVTGSYQLNFYSIIQGNYTNGYIQLYVSGSRIYGGDTHFTLANNSGHWHNVSYSQTLYLSANQYVEIFSYTGTGSGNVVWHGNNWGCFSGYLIG